MGKLEMFIPQWQGSGNTKEIYEGSYAVKEVIEGQGDTTFRSIYIDSKSIPVLKNNILGYDIIINQLQKVQAILNVERPSKVFALGGGCGIEIPIVSYLKEKYKELTLYWFDAHGDLNTPQSSPSKHFHGMPLRFLTEKRMGLSNIHINSIPPTEVNLLGVRDLDEPEKLYIENNNINIIPVEIIKDIDLFKSSISRRCGKAYIHVDLDVLDPKHYRNVKCPTDCGLSIEELTYSIENIRNLMEVVGFSIVENTELDKKEIMKLNEIFNIGINF